MVPSSFRRFSWAVGVRGVVTGSGAWSGKRGLIMGVDVIRERVRLWEYGVVGRLLVRVYEKGLYSWGREGLLVDVVGPTM